MPTPQEQTPEQWLKKLIDRQDKRRRGIQLAKAYYEGLHKLTFVSDKFKEHFGGLFDNFSDNWCGVVVQAPAERLRVQGIRLRLDNDGKDDLDDKTAWRIWQENDLDSASMTHHTSTLATAYGYVLVWAADGKPLITVEDPEQAIVAYAPGTNQRAAGLKRWIDEWTGHEIAYLYRPEAIYKFRTRKPRAGRDVVSETEDSSKDWERFQPPGEEEWPLPHAMGKVPLVEFVNDPTTDGRGRSEITRVMPLQNMVNMMAANLAVAGEFSAFRQKVVMGYAPDPSEQQKEEGLSTSQVQRQAEMQASQSRAWMFGSKDVKVHEFSETNLKNYVEAIEMFVQHIAAQTRTPRHYFTQTGQSPSGDAIKSAETGLVAKVRERMVHYGERWEEVMRLALSVSGSDAKAPAAELRWADPEYRTEAQHTDSVIKRYKAGLIPWRTAVEELGYTDDEIRAMERNRTRDALTAQAVDVGKLLDEDVPESDIDAA